MFLKIHIITVSLSYAAFLAASIAAILFLIQNSAIKHKRSNVILNRLPDLAILDKIIYRSIGLGFPLLTLSIFSGFVWSKDVHGAYWWGYDFRHISSVVLWLIYALILHVRLSARMRGRKVASLSVFAFFVMILSLFGSCP